MAKIFISYRRDDSAGHAGRLYDRLSDHFGPDEVFMDVDAIKPGRDFVDEVRQAVGACDGLIAIIGREWLTISDATGAPRLNHPDDIASLEIATALERGIRVIPVLVQGARMPAATDLPESLKQLANRNAQEISDRSFNSDAKGLVEALEAPEPPKREDFVGRQRQMAELSVALDAAIAGRGQMVMLAGEPGIGKTRLAQELAFRAESLGAQVLWGWCYEHAGAPPYWPYVHPIRTYVETADPSQLSSQIGSGGAAIAEIIPELREKLPDLGQAVAVDPDQARFRPFDSIATFLKNAAQNKPLLFVVDDLHWADSSSLLMLEFLVREITASPVLVLGIYRDVEITASHPMSQTLGNLVRERHYRRVQLDGLTQQEVGEFVKSSKGVSLTDDILETIHSRTDGNPLFVHEVVELIDPDHMTENTAWTDIIPKGVRDAIGSRLSRLSENCNQVLSTASVIGREFEFALLRSLDPDISADGVLAALDEALEAKVIEELPAPTGRYQFGHALIQLSLYGEMSSARRLRVHVGIGETLEQTHASNLAAHAAEIAYHFAESESVTGPEKLARYSLIAGERALATHAYEDALAHFERGLIAKEIDLTGAGPAPDEETAALMFGLAKAQASTRQVNLIAGAFGAFSFLSRAFEYYFEAGHVAQAVATAEFPLAPPTLTNPDSTQMLARALSLVPDDSHDAGRLLSRYGGMLGLAANDYEGSQQALGRAIAIARREKDVGLEMQTLAYAADVSGNHLRWQESVDNGLRAIQLATDNENAYSEVLPRWWTIVGSQHLGNLELALAHALPLRALAERRSTPLLLASIGNVPLVSLPWLMGDWQEGRGNSDRNLEMSPVSQAPLGLRVLMEYETGAFDQGEIYLERLLEAMRLAPGQSFTTGRTFMVILTAARITGVPKHLDVAESIAKSTLLTQSVPPLLALYAKAALAMLAVHRGDQSAVAEYSSSLLKQCSTMLWTTISVDRLLGLSYQTMENPDQAAAHFEDALAFCRRAGYRPELAWSCCDYADTLLARNGEGDIAKAASLLDESLAIATELGMRPLMERVSARQQRIET